MYRIVICEDDEVMAAHVHEMAGCILTEREIEHRIDVVYSGAALLELLSAPDSDCHMILLDILMDDLTGMEAARRLRETGHPASIIFITVTDRFAVEGYDVGAASYLLKPVQREQLGKRLLADYQNNYTTRYLVLPQRAQVHNIPIRAIRYIEIAHRKLAIHLTGATILHTAKIDDIQRQLPPHLFVRCHKSYLVNIECVVSVSRYRARLATGEQIPISKVQYDHVRARFLTSLEDAEQFVTV